jgi:hypothetical protein
VSLCLLFREFFDQFDNHRLVTDRVIERQVRLEERHDGAGLLEPLAYAIDGSLRGTGYSLNLAGFVPMTLAPRQILCAAPIPSPYQPLGLCRFFFDGSQESAT